MIAFSSNYLIGPRTLKLIFESGPKKVWLNGLKLGVAKIPQKNINAVNETRLKLNPDDYISRVEKLGFKVLVNTEKSYPCLLKEIPDPPIVLYYIGELVMKNLVSVVGSRKCSQYAKQVTETIAPDLSRAGLTIVSGMALGVDTMAHRAALSSQGKTLAVLGSGLDTIYPSSNKSLYSEIAKNGAVISEFPLGTPPLKYNFPQRNRIIAGLAESTLIIEADIHSGSLITGHFALDFNRQVYAIPGDITRNNSRGTNNLIKLGAKPVTESQDILIDYGILPIEKKLYLPKNDTERTIYEVLGDSPLYIDKISELTGLDAILISQSITLLELQGAIINLGNSTYIRK